MTNNPRKLAQDDTRDILRRKFFRAIVTSTSPFEITREGRSDAQTASRLDSYTPTLNDLVIVQQIGPRPVVLGKEIP